MAKQKRYYALVTTGSNDASFARDSIFDSPTEAVAEFKLIADHHIQKGWAVVEFLSITELSTEIIVREQPVAVEDFRR